MNDFFTTPSAPNYEPLEENINKHVIQMKKCQHKSPNIYMTDQSFSIKDDFVMHHTSIDLPFHSSIEIYIPLDKIQTVLNISLNIKYNIPKQTLTAYCDSIAHNMILLYLAVQVSMGKLSVKTIQKKDLIQKYFDGKKKSPTKVKSSLMRLLSENRKKYKY